MGVCDLLNPCDLELIKTNKTSFIELQNGLGLKGP